MKGPSVSWRGWSCWGVELNSKLSGLHQNKIPEIFFVYYHPLGWIVCYKWCGYLVSTGSIPLKFIGMYLSTRLLNKINFLFLNRSPKIIIGVKLMIGLQFNSLWYQKVFQTCLGPNKIIVLPLKNFFSKESNKVLLIIITNYIYFLVIITTNYI